MTKPSTRRTLPNSDEIEISVFGPGFGECIVAHIGAGHWLVVDSCIDKQTQTPVALAYFNELGIDPATSVDLVLATHWHDDHVAGIDEVMAACPNAQFWCSDALRSPEFLQLTEVDLKRKGLKFTRGVKYIGSLIDTLGHKFNFALASMRILKTSLSIGGQTIDVEAWSLSPSQAEHVVALRNLSDLFNATGPETTLPDRNPNHASVAMLLSIGEQQILLGADLEETGNSGHGWSAVVSNTTRPHPIRADAFKVPHHGSVTGHLDAAWSDLTNGEPIAVLTPYRIGDNVLPQPTDVTRIVKLSKSAFITKESYDQRPVKRPVSIAKLAPATLRRLHKTPGHVRLRRPIASTGDWEVTLFDGATELANFKQPT
ncbi:MBL fold metallo-hydrolase [Bradyrhizobium sp. RT7b]|uniref:MBL fold metallo-hydrolase n=1 Tax=unclassified Bradyrhizobium TaxID=2631580 RepID=UPI0033959026